MTKTCYAQYNVTERGYAREDGEIVDLNEAYLFGANEKQSAIESLNCFDEPENWRVIGVKISYETFEI